MFRPHYVHQLAHTLLPSRDVDCKVHEERLNPPSAIQVWEHTQLIGCQEAAEQQYHWTNRRLPHQSDDDEVHLHPIKGSWNHSFKGAALGRDTSVAVFTVQLGEPATFTCRLPEDQDSRVKIHWYKQNAGDTLKIIVSLWKLSKPKYGPEYSASRLNVTLEEKFSNLTIVRTVQEDEGMYHCAFNDWSKNIWHSMYLSLKGLTERTSNYTVVQQTAASDPDGPGGSATLQCSLLSGSKMKTCSGGLRVFWFRARSEKSYPDMIYTEGKRHDECKKKPDSQNRCVFFKNISSTDAGTFHCAVATCGQILFGNELKVQGNLIV
ncbi:uncharacterized protein LOC119408652 [Nematolebias whitei]|uniref:uncharacterized protein LOC119408652 n=1 Tax=Nematolebias whitei TaxID=451745 RepID=UPI001899B80F|nr:uncharacterized protein LOC119408652 [Nematolebias whitei]